MGWDEPVSDSAVYLPYSGGSFSANQNQTGVTGGFKQRLTAWMLAESRACWQEPNKMAWAIFKAAQRQPKL
jgi:hypothetical protein